LGAALHEHLGSGAQRSQWGGSSERFGARKPSRPKMALYENARRKPRTWRTELEDHGHTVG
jgi:hypothetical protein